MKTDTEILYEIVSMMRNVSSVSNYGFTHNGPGKEPSLTRVTVCVYLDKPVPEQRGWSQADNFIDALYLSHGKQPPKLGPLPFVKLPLHHEIEAAHRRQETGGWPKPVKVDRNEDLFEEDEPNSDLF